MRAELEPCGTRRRFGRRGCGRMIRWVTTEKGKAMPIDPAPNPNGNVVLLDNFTAHVLHKGEDPGGRDRYMPHFATCPILRRSR
jgi:hypothetical protein